MRPPATSRSSTPTTQAVIGTAPLGKRPRGIKASPDGKSLYVALSGSPNAGPGVDVKTLPPPDRSADGIGEVDADTYKVKRVIRAGNDPEQLDISADGTAAVCRERRRRAGERRRPAVGNVVATVKMGEEPEGVTIRPDGKVVYVTSEDEGAVYAIDTATNKVLKKVPVGHRPRSIGFLPDGSRAYVSLENDGAIAVVDGQAAQVPAPDSARRQRATRRSRGRWASRSIPTDRRSTSRPARSAACSWSIRRRTRRPTSIRSRPAAVGRRLLPDGKTIYTANGPSNDVSVIDLATKRW